MILKKKDLYLIQYISIKCNLFSFTILFLLLSNSLMSQRDMYGDKMSNVITPVEVYVGDKIIKATGIYYNHIQIDTIEKDTISQLYLVSNLHVFKPKGLVPDSIKCFIRGRKGNVNISVDDWSDITFRKPELDTNISTHINLSIDVAVIKISSGSFRKDSDFYQYEYITPVQSLAVKNYAEEELPYIGDRVVVLGYPDGFYDYLNKLPIAKSGIVSSFYSRNYDGYPKFLIDSKLYKSFSGSVVIYLPNEAIVIDGKLQWFKDGKPIVYVGIYSGEVYIESNPVETDESIIVKKIRMDLGNVWYLSTIDEIIERNFIKN